MKIILLCLLFLPIIYLAARQKKWYLYLLLAFWAVIPEQTAVSLHDKLPLISVGRLLVMLVFGFWVYERYEAKKLVLPISMLVFLGINLVVSLVNFRYGFGEINRIFLLLFERVLPVIMIADMIQTREEFDTGIDFMILGAVALAVIGILQTTFDYDISTPLHWVKTMSSITLSQRMGMTRAFATYNAISFGCYCVLASMSILYRLFNTKKFRYSIALTLVTLAMIFSLSRSAWLCMLAILFIMIVFTKGKLFLRILPATGLIVLLFLVLVLFQPSLKNAFVETGKSTINTMLQALPDSISSPIVELFGSDTEATVPTTTDSSGKPAAEENENSTKPKDNETGNTSNRFQLDENFGLNGEDPSYSRMAQWTAIQHMADNGNLLFGLGYNALPEGRIHFFFDRWDAQWVSTSFLDVGLVALFAESGLLGALAFGLLLGYMFVCSFLSRDRKNIMDFYHVTMYFVPLFLLLNFMAAFMFEDLLWMMIGMFYAWRGIHTAPETNRDLWQVFPKRSKTGTRELPDANDQTPPVTVEQKDTATDENTLQ